MRVVSTMCACAVLGAAAFLGGAAAGQEPGAQVRIVRDTYGVPHVFADTQEAASYGAGYALAQDRLWQMHVFRHIAKGRLSELFGPLVVDIDKTVRFFTYTQDERSRRLATYPLQIQSNLAAFADGINAWIAEARSDPSKLPVEFAELGGGPPADWSVDDSVALQDVLVLAFGSGGGEELRYAELLERLVERHGPEAGGAMFDDLVTTEDPDAPTTIPRGYNWRRTSTAARSAEAETARTLEADARLSLAIPAPAAAVRARNPVAGTSAQLRLVPDAGKALRESAALRRGLETIRAIFDFGSNAQLVDARRSETGNTLQTAGPQVDYMVPQWLADFGIHGGGLDATGMTFAGAGPAVLIGRGPGYAWTTTTGSSDLSDTYVEHLAGPRSYVFGGRVEPMDCRTETYAFRGLPFDEQEICRTRHGPVAAFDRENGVAYSLRNAWFNREGQTVEGFFGYNAVRSLEDFATAANKLASNHNMFYSDDQGASGYWTPGNHPLRAEGVDLRLPQDGGGSSEWRGLLPVRKVPHAVDLRRGWLANWNNQPAGGWRRERAWEANDNVTDLFTAFGSRATPDPDGGAVNPDRLWGYEDLNANLRHAALKSHEESWFRSALPAPEALTSELARRALEIVRDWDGFLTDRNDDGRYDSAGEHILDRWLGVMREAIFRDELGPDVGFARTDAELWHVVSPDSTRELRVDWLNGLPASQVVAESFEEAVRRIAADEEDGDPAGWRREIRRQRYQRIGSDFPADLIVSLGGDPSPDTGLPGDIPEHLEMDRGTYNHVIQYLDPPGPQGRRIGHSRVKAGSVIPPGQSGFVDLLGREDEHFEDQLELYVEWRYKPMPLLADEVRRQAESVETLTYGG